MMKIKRILLTGDDGYNSLGTRLLIHFLRDRYELMIVGTRDQQSGVGGHISLRTGCGWGEATVDGVSAYWVDGYPADAIESAVGFYGTFDLVVSGINLGSNIGPGVTSGTVSAAMRALSVGLSTRAIVLSWHTPPSFWFKQHPSTDGIDEYLEYPGCIAYELVERAIGADLWSADIINVNFPEKTSRILQFTEPIHNLCDFYHFPVDRDEKTHTFKYSSNDVLTQTKSTPTIDTGALLNGYISVSPYNVNYLNKELFNKLKKKRMSL